jgi:RNA-directed DNA polymerase
VAGAQGVDLQRRQTRIVHLDDGVGFLGFNVRRYRGKLLIKPSDAVVTWIRARLTAEMRALRGHNAQRRGETAGRLARGARQAVTMIRTASNAGTWSGQASIGMR